MKFKLEKFHRNIPDDELVQELLRCHAELEQSSEALTYRSYSKVGKYTASIFSNRFGSWNEALKISGLVPNETRGIENAELVKNLEEVWIVKGKQPVYRDMNTTPSKYSASTYQDRFGSWRKALDAFIAYINEDTEKRESTATKDINKNTPQKRKRTSRHISDRLRFRILSRDGFTCQSCGASPIKTRGVELHVDHILPWSKGGETEESNLQTKCKQCNLGKGNAFSE